MTRERRKRLRKFFRRLFSRKLVIVAAAIVVFFIFAAIFASFLSPYGPYQQDLANLLSKPSSIHWLGTDRTGRDVLTRILHGARTSLVVGVVSALMAATIGTLLGLIAGYYGGIINAVLSRIIDMMMSIPSLMLALALGLVFGRSIISLMIVLGISTVPTYSRLMNVQVFSVKNADYIVAEKVLGSNNRRILFSDILPNCLSPIIVLVTANIGTTILAESSLSFLGMGVNPPMASWGGMVSDGITQLLTNPVFALAPGVCIMLLVFGFNVLGDGLRDTLDPRLRGSI